MCQAKYLQLKPEKILYVSLSLDGLCTENYNVNLSIRDENKLQALKII